MPRRSEEQQTGRYSYEGLERLLHERSRLSILTSLSSHPQGLLFNDLKKLCALTDGNLSRQIQILEEAALVEVWKGQTNKRPRTLVKLTPTGRQRFLDYIQELESVVRDAMQSRRSASPRSAPTGFSPA